MTKLQTVAAVALSVSLIACAGPRGISAVGSAECAAISDCVAGRAICVVTAARDLSVEDLRATDAYQDMRAQLENLVAGERPVRFIETKALGDIVVGPPVDLLMRTLILGARGEGIGYADIFTDDSTEAAAFMREPAAATVPPGFKRISVAANPAACPPPR